MHEHVAIQTRLDRVGATLRVVEGVQRPVSPRTVVDGIERDRREAAAGQPPGQVQQISLLAAEAVQQEDHRAAQGAGGEHGQCRNFVDGQGFADDFHTVSELKPFGFSVTRRV